MIYFIRRVYIQPTKPHKHRENMKPAKDHYVVNIASFVVALIDNRSDSTHVYTTLHVPHVHRKT